MGRFTSAVKALVSRLGGGTTPQVRRLLIGGMYARMPVGLVGNLLVAGTLVLVLPAPDGRRPLLLWGLACLLLTCLRFLDVVGFRRHPPEVSGLQRREFRLVAGAALQGCFWGALSWFRFPVAPLDQLYLTLVMSGLAGAGVLFLSPLPLAYTLYVLPIMVPNCIRYLAGDQALQQTAGLLGLVYVAVMLLTANRAGGWLVEALGRSCENEDLVTRLQAANASLETHRSRLEQVVAERTESLLLAVERLSEGLRETEQERRQAAESAAIHRHLLESINEGFGHVDANEVFLFANPAAEKIFGVPPGTLVGRSLADFLDADALALVQEQTGRRRQGADNRYVLSFIRADGQHRQMYVKATPLGGGGGPYLGASAVFEDITEQRRLEALQHRLQAELHHAQKLESIGSLAGGVAHDMNNVLAAVQAIVQTLQQRHAGDSRLQADLGVIERASTRGRDLVKSLTNFVRKELQEPERLSLNDLVREEVELLGRTTLQRIALVMDLEDPLPPVLGERGPLGGALMNLCVNALDAMGDQGMLTLRTRVVEAGWVGVSVIDNGKGMAPEVVARAMEPFFTTKAIGQGTGLGLAMVYATAKAHGGSVQIWSEEGRGTTVLVRLPVAGGDQADPPGAAGPEAAAARLRILQVDDDELILASVPLMLENLGHSVETASGGQEALDRLGAGLVVDLVILDLNMPGMNGRETLRRVRQQWPELPVLMASGYLDPDTEQILKHAGRVGGISKPFSMAELEANINKVVRQEPAAR
jgi:PAS domain S-box-containing protein